MYQFFIEPSGVQDGRIVITGTDVNHIKNVLRMHVGEKIAAVDESGERKWICEIGELRENSVRCDIVSVEDGDTELPAKIFLFQGLPKGDKMELILQKAVEVRQGDTPKVLQQRVMEEAEWKILPEAIHLIANGRVRVDERNHVVIEGA